MTWKSICAVGGVKAGGMKEGKFGLALIQAQGTAAGVFTENLVKAAPVELMRKQIKAGKLEAVIVNSGCANAYTGKQGYADAVAMTEYAGTALGVKPAHIGVASTGVIGRYLDLPLIKRQCMTLAPTIARTPEAEILTAKAIMTTDLYPKHALVKKENFTVAGITKGSGMIAPNMGTMLAFIYTDAEIGAKPLADALKLATRRTFNRVVVDGDTSTNDIALCTATGEAGKVKAAEFSQALEECCRSLAKQIAADGEGASKLLEIVVKGAKKEDDAAKVARTIIESPLVKTAVYGEDPNWGRVIAAAGRAGVKFDPNAVSLWISDGKDKHPLVKSGEIIADLKKAKEAMHGKQVTFILDLAAGKEKATAWGCDLTEKYVEINGKYTHMKREDVLIEALPYIQQFHGKTIVIKLGGHAMVDPVVLENAIRDVVLLHYVGIRVVLVHGGGPEISDKMKQMGKESVFVGGLRVTDNETLEIAQMVLVGKINANIVSLIAKCGARGVGISGSDGNLILAKKMDLQKVEIGGIQKDVDLGHVGEIESIDPALLNTLLDTQYIPVIAPIAIDRFGGSLNINADTAAGDIAIALKAFKLINMTDVDGVMDKDRTKVFRRLSSDEANELRKSGAIGEGMIPKVKSVIKAVENGVNYSHIINGNTEHNLILELFTRDGVGTMISRR